MIHYAIKASGITHSEKLFRIGADLSTFILE